jgi:hypothetical protein
VPDLDGDEPDGTDECLCPHDVRKNGPITDDELYESFSSLERGAKLLMISDSCHSGTVTRFAPITTPPAAKGGSPSAGCLITPLVAFFYHRTTKPHPDQFQDRPVSDPSFHHRHQFVMGNAVKITAQIRVIHLMPTHVQIPSDFLHGP